ncbi:hypothetical protein [Pseudogemmobacter bohemicus]|uniref:hypothetical protein n=1 Tax=Pseudogemmobacter bohemicus TaxID=2250708 RepID=UPI0013005445|nr:hypothetical protein [Pseudogemmobacter bohemicus]
MPSPFRLTFLDNGGTGFLVTNDTDTWLLTCLHLVTELIDTPLTHPMPLQGVFGIPDLGLSITVNFEVGRVLLVPRGDDLHDILRITLTEAERAAFAPFGAYRVADISLAQVGESLEMRGFPIIAGHQGAMRTAPVTVEQIEGVSIKMHQPAVGGGMSGGPLVRGNALIGIVHGSVGPAPGYENALANSFAVLGPTLFGQPADN